MKKVIHLEISHCFSCPFYEIRRNAGPYCKRIAIDIPTDEMGEGIFPDFCKYPDIEKVDSDGILAKTTGDLCETNRVVIEQATKAMKDLIELLGHGGAAMESRSEPEVRDVWEAHFYGNVTISSIIDGDFPYMMSEELGAFSRDRLDRLVSRGEPVKGDTCEIIGGHMVEFDRIHGHKSDIYKMSDEHYYTRNQFRIIEAAKEEA